MKDETILKKAIEKAVKNGWKLSTGMKYFISYRLQSNPNKYHLLGAIGIIFSHDFAKAFWGKEKGTEAIFGKNVKHRGGTWQFHLQQMVLETNPIKYLEKFLEE